MWHFFQNESGDVLVQLIYNDSGSLHIMVKSVKMPSNVPPESLSGLFTDLIFVLYLTLVLTSATIIVSLVTI